MGGATGRGTSLKDLFGGTTGRGTSLKDLFGRRAEREAIERLLARARSGKSGTLVVRGEAGIGKTALLEYARDTASRSGFRVETLTGVPSETQFAFAGLHQLCARLMDRADALPAPQRAALGVVFGLRAGPAPDRFLVGLAILSLLAEVAEEEGLVCLVDDAQWLDEASSQVLTFAARRLGAERLVLVFAVRDSTEGDALPFTGMPEVRLGPLAEHDAQALLTAAAPALLDEAVRDRIVAEARGNPLALLELPMSAPPTRWAGGYETPDLADAPSRVEDSFRRRSSNLPAETQLLLLVAAAEPTGEVALLCRATEALGIASEASAPAEAAGLLDIDTRVRFRHPLVRSAVYRTAHASDRRRAHRALAEATDPRLDPDRRAWHQAQAVLGVDEKAAAELEHSAERARARGGLAAAAAFLERATELTPDEAERARRALEAAHAKHEAGAYDVALDLLRLASAGPLDALQDARAEQLRAQIEFHTTRGSEVPGMLLDAAETLAPLDPTLSRETYLYALTAAIHAGSLARGRGLPEAAKAAAEDAPAQSGPPGAVDLLLDGLSTRFTQGFEASVPSLQGALQALRSDDSRDDVDGRWLWLACHVAAVLWDDRALYDLADRAVRLARESGSLATLPGVLNSVASVLVLFGELTRAAALAQEESAITQAIGVPPLSNARLMLAAWSGRHREALDLYATMVQEATERGEATSIDQAQATIAAMHNGLGNYEEALTFAIGPCSSEEMALTSLALPELIEAATRSGDHERARAASDLLSRRTRASGAPFGLGLAACGRALISTGAEAEEHYLEAIELLGRTQMAVFLARAHLVYGEWLRREGRREEAREQLRTAHEKLSAMGTEAFAERAARELRATGEHPRSRTAQPTDALTAQELHISRLVATGATSREIGAQLFLSPRTIEAHLRNIFRKLGITSRRQLKDFQLQ
ncbi:ATP-binding protein [Aeromicrobium duanguangcaii]|uniref:AAA family ATPase n=1 Tax=Aeromicrobium duanguangcaii TaxID=2968086 RepID=A0ABY5KDE3_9ACTN|nr:LuxR family transcriptional regulator [Aeromicrobium duanguangcaii]MCD9154762.1 AAA family ATPase [Aeromicrobium duanguangcaii]UUI67824.1 AAA family ATPase [Aeromicrobium duanguangcaii]